MISWLQSWRDANLAATFQQNASKGDRMASRKWVWLAMAGVSSALVACGGGGTTVEPVSLDPTVLCNSAGVQPKVFNGASCVSYKSTPVVLLAIQEADGSYSSCSGTRISANQVLTAAHCVSDSPKRVIAANFKSDTSITGIDATSWVAHPAYSTTGFVNDAAVVSFPAGLPNPTMPVLASESAIKGQAVFFAGWGLPSNELAVGAANLSAVSSEYLSINFDGSQSNTCQGDSGGPMYRMLAGGAALVGITSSGTSAACGAGERSLFTNIHTPTVLDFIRTHAPTASYI
jgi:secreted trypsin-like serine protease